MHFRRSRRNGITVYCNSVMRSAPTNFVMCIIVSSGGGCARGRTSTRSLYGIRTRAHGGTARTHSQTSRGGQVIFVYNILLKPPVDTIILNMRDRHTHIHANCYIYSNNNNNNNNIVGNHLSVFV